MIRICVMLLAVLLSLDVAAEPPVPVALHKIYRDIYRLERRATALEERADLLEADMALVLEYIERQHTNQDYRSLRRWVKHMQDDVDELKAAHGND